MDSSSLVLCLLNAFLSSITIILNIVTIHAIRNTSPLSKNLKTLLLSLAVSDLGVGLLSQPTFATYIIMESKQSNGSSKAFNAIRIAFLTPTNLFGFATLFLIIVLCAERFADIHFYFRYQELVTHKRVVAVVVLIWAFSALISLMRLWFPKKIMYVVFGIIHSACIIAATFFSARIYFSVQRHLQELRVLQMQQARKNGQMANIKRLRKFAIMAVYVCLVLVLCYLPNICALFVTAFGSTGSKRVITYLQLYTVTLELLNSTLNPLIYSWKMKHVRHTIIGLLRDAFSKHN